MAANTGRPIRQYVVGDKKDGADYSQSEIEALVYKVAVWFASPECPRKYEDTVQAAKDKIRECLLGLNAEGDPWVGCPEDFQKRVKIKCAYDMIADRGIYTAKQHKQMGKKAANRGVAADNAKEVMRQIDPIEAKFDAEGFRAKVEKDILDAFPELDNPAHRPNVRSLSGLYAQREVIDRELAAGVSTSKRETLLRSLKIIEEMADGTMRRLGVHPDQVRKKIADKASASISDLVAMIGDDKEFAQREKVWSLQLALQLWWMSEHWNGTKSGPQLHDFEIWHLTRSRPIRHRCKCGFECVIIEGFEPHELRDYLVANGVLVEEPVLPGVVPQAALAGLATVDLRPLETTPLDATAS
jgi:hypothetical protein